MDAEALIRLSVVGRRGLFLAALLSLPLLAAFHAVALAHATYVRSLPEADARLTRPPAEVRVTFSEPVEPRFSEIQVLDTKGARVERGPLAQIDAATLRVGLGPVSDGGYTVSWRVLSAVDGHETRGSFAFAVGDAPLPTLPDIDIAPPPPPLDVAGRALSFLGLSLLLGGSVFALAVALRDADRRGVDALARGGAAALVVGTALVLLQAGGPALLLGSRLGSSLGARGLLAVVALALPWTRARVGLGALLALSFSLQSHAAAFGDARQVVVDAAHVVAASTWSGALVALGLLALPRRRSTTGEEARDLGALVWRFSVLGLVSVGTLAATGALQALSRLADPLDLVETPYGLAVSAKIALLVVAVALAAPNLLRHGPMLRAARDAPRTRGLLLLGVRGEVAAVGLILLASSLLTASAPPGSPAGGGIAEVRHDAGLRIELLARAASPGPNRYVVRLREGLATTPSDVEKVSLRFTMVEHDMGEQELVLRERAAGEYASESSAMSMYGTWRIQVVVRRDRHDEARALFVVGATAAAEAGAAAQILQAGTLTLVVFTEPAKPTAGQPLTLDVVAIDPTGNPVADARVSAELEGRTFDAISEGNGRYRVELAPLDAGDKSFTIRTAGRPGAGEARYRLTVAP